MNPMRRASRALAMAWMRPPLAQQLYLHRPAANSVDLTGKRVLLTGASSGIGEAAAHLLAQQGATVILVARRADRLDQVAEQITADGGAAIALPCDLSDLEAVDDLITVVKDLLGVVDVLINNAGRSIRRPLAESLERWHDVERTMQLNYYAPLRLIRGFAPAMARRGDGHIINVATWGVLSESSPLFGVYNASKAALSTVSRVIDMELADEGVRSTTLYYPLVATPMIAPSTVFDGAPALTPQEAAEWMLTAARRRPVRIAPRMALLAQAVDTVSPSWIDAVLKRQQSQPDR